MSNIFSKIPKTKVGSNTFDLTHDVKLTANFGKLIPIMATETIPGDKFTISGSCMARLAPMVAPVMHRADMYVHYFFVPNRIIWDNWEQFITGGEDGTAAPAHPVMTSATTANDIGTLKDYFGMPVGEDVGPTKAFTVNALPFFAYRKIYNDYYRDQNLIPKVEDKAQDGNNTPVITGPWDVYKRAWNHDYFTSALPFTQRGPEALIPMGTTAPLQWVEDAGGVVRQTFRSQGGLHNPISSFDVYSDAGARPNNPASTQTVFVDVAESHEVDLSTATQTTIIELRRAIKLQEWLEKNAVGGARYVEQLYVHFGVNSSDKRLQRPEYIGGYQQPIKFSEVLQTSESATTPQGNMAGHGISVGGSKNYKFYAEEHGWIIGILSILPKTGYQQGIHKSLLRREKLDYAFPTFAHIGEQPIENQELYLSGASVDQETFGYTPRYSEYKFMNNRVAGEFRTTLDFWHMSRKFSTLPNLNQDFIECDETEVERIFAVTTGDPIWMQVLNEVRVNRKLPVFGTPRL